MAQIEPLKAIRYNAAELSSLIAPPYDILDQADKNALLEKNEHNIVGIDLPHVPPKTAGPDRVYAQAAGELTRWLDIRTLVHDRKPALYAYHQTYSVGKKTLTRKTFFTRLHLEPFGEGQVYAHEQTFGGPKEDRLKLTRATACNLSPIFALYPDAKNEVAAIIDDAIGQDPDQFGMLDGVQNKLWVIDHLPTIKSIQASLADKPVFIADGHHRYGTALMYQKEREEELGELQPNDPVNFVLAVLGGMEDPGAVIQPYFRTIIDTPSLLANTLQKALVEKFQWMPATKPADEHELAKALSTAGPQAMMLYVAKDDAYVTIAPKAADFLAALEPKRHAAWRQLSYTILHRYLLQEALPKLMGGKEPEVHYHKSMSEAVNDAKKTTGIACLMPATTMAQLREICLAGELMPQKSTYFAPKLATGMVINPLY